MKSANHTNQMGRLGVRAAVIATAIVAAAAMASSCAQPVHDLQVKALGGEAAGVPVGEFHRAGQPCATCHGELGPASTVFSIAGTVFNGPNQAIGEENVMIELVDALGYKPPITVLTNCVGNFAITPDVWDPAYPVLVYIRKNSPMFNNGTQLKQMQSHIGREPSCSQCHKDPASFDSPGHVHLFDQLSPGVDDPKTQDPSTDCPVPPDLNAGSSPAPASSGM